MQGDINRDWKNVDWYACASDFDKRITISATVNSAEVRAYDFSTADLPPEAARLFNDMLAALKQHREEQKEPKPWVCKNYQPTGRRENRRGTVSDFCRQCGHPKGYHEILQA